MPPRKKLRAVEPSSGTASKVSCEGTLTYGSFCRSREEVCGRIRAITEALGADDDAYPMDCARPTSRRVEFDQATSALSTSEPTLEGLMGEAGGPWAFVPEVSTNVEDCRRRVWTIDLKFDADVVVTRVSIEGFTRDPGSLDAKVERASCF